MNLRPAVAGFPKQVWQENRERDGTAEPNPFRTEQMSPSREQESHHESEAEDQHAVFIFEADTGDRSEGQPQLRRCALDDQDRDPGTEQPEKRLEGVHGKEAVESEIGRREQNRRGGQKLRQKTAAEIARYAASEIHNCCSGDRRTKTQREERIAGRMANDPSNECDQRRLVHITPGEMLSASHVIQLIAEKSVMIDARELYQQFAEGQRQQQIG